MHWQQEIQYIWMFLNNVSFLQWGCIFARIRQIVMQEEMLWYLRAPDFPAASAGCRCKYTTKQGSICNICTKESRFLHKILNSHRYTSKRWFANWSQLSIRQCIIVKKTTLDKFQIEYVKNAVSADVHLNHFNILCYIIDLCVCKNFLC